ncbi:DgaE family pyridoxal phosphate-dependent ammonia lyase [Listeria innocua]
MIGFGKGGKTLAKALASKGESVLVVEKSTRMYGGTCINIGCIPSKSLIFNGERGIDFTEAVARKEKLTGMLRAKNYHMISDEATGTVMDGTARYANHEKFQLKKVINASGRMTILGVSTLSETVLDAQRFGGQHFFEMEELSIQTGKYLADLLEVEDVQIVSSASAGIAQSVAAVIGKGELYPLYHPYAESIKKRQIILPKGHNVDYGTAVEIMVQQGGGQVVEAGYANMCTPEQIEMMITEETAGILYIKSHHTVQKSMLDVSEAAQIAKKHQLPLIVDAAAEEDLKKYVQLGADLVIYSGAKAIEGPSAGMVIGKKTYVSWVRMQSKGIGRSMICRLPIYLSCLRL